MRGHAAELVQENDFSGEMEEATLVQAAEPHGDSPGDRPRLLILGFVEEIDRLMVMAVSPQRPDLKFRSFVHA